MKYSTDLPEIKSQLMNCTLYPQKRLTGFLLTSISARAHVLLQDYRTEKIETELLVLVLNDD